MGQVVKICLSGKRVKKKVEECKNLGFVVQNNRDIDAGVSFTKLEQAG